MSATVIQKVRLGNKGQPLMAYQKMSKALKMFTKSETVKSIKSGSNIRSIFSSSTCLEFLASQQLSRDDFAFPRLQSTPFPRVQSERLALPALSLCPSSKVFTPIPTIYGSTQFNESSARSNTIRLLFREDKKFCFKVRLSTVARTKKTRPLQEKKVNRISLKNLVRPRETEVRPGQEQLSVNSSSSVSPRSKVKYGHRAVEKKLSTTNVSPKSQPLFKLNVQQLDEPESGKQEVGVCIKAEL